MLDSDDCYIYLGPTSDQISQAIKKDRVIFIQVLENKDAFSTLMDSLNTKSKRDMN